MVKCCVFFAVRTEFLNISFEFKLLIRNTEVVIIYSEHFSSIQNLQLDSVMLLLDKLWYLTFSQL
jgi:hypothetical protein